MEVLYHAHLITGRSFEKADHLKALLQGGDGVTGWRNEARLRALDNIFTASDSHYLESLLGDKVDYLPQYLQGEAVMEIINTLVERADPCYRFQLAVLLSQVHRAKRPHEVNQKIGDSSLGAEFNIRPVHEKIWLCDSAEPRMLYALNRGKVTVVDHALVVKNAGVTAALCVRPITSLTGQTFVPGVWYTPSNEDGLRYALEDSIEQGEHQVHFNSGTWSVIRAISSGAEASTDKLMRLAQEAAA